MRGTMLNQIGRVLSLYQTPHRRKEELMKISGVSQDLAERLTAASFQRFQLAPVCQKAASNV